MPPSSSPMLLRAKLLYSFYGDWLKFPTCKHSTSTVKTEQCDTCQAHQLSILSTPEFNFFFNPRECLTHRQSHENVTPFCKIWSHAYQSEKLRKSIPKIIKLINWEYPTKVGRRKYTDFFNTFQKLHQECQWSENWL